MLHVINNITVKKGSEAVAQRCFVKKVFLEISRISQENTCARVSSLIKLQGKPAILQACEFCEISKSTFSYRTPLVAASEEYPFKTYGS